MVFETDNPCVMYVVVDSGAMLKPGASTCTARLVVAVRDPETPVMVARYDPRMAELSTVSVSTLLPVAGFGANDAVTAAGRSETDRLTSPVNPPTSLIVIVVMPDAPGLIVRL